MKVLVTGASGFVGHALTQKLINRNPASAVRILLRKPPPDGQFDPTKVEVFIGDVTDPKSLQRATENIEIVYHLAGVVGYSIKDRKIMELVNVGGTRHTIEAFKKSKCRRLIHMSSVAAVGASLDGQKPLDENSEYNLHPLNLGYFETKKAAENLVLAATRNGEIDAVVLNPSNIYGAGDAQKGSRSTQIKVAAGKFPYYTSGGVSVVHVDDVTDALISAAERGRSGERYILSGDNLRIYDLFAQIADCAGVAPPRWLLPNIVIRALAEISEALERRGKKGPVSSESARASILYHWFDCSKARRDLNFNPRPSHDAIRDSVTWMKSHGVI